MKLEKEQQIKLLLAIWVILSHLPGFNKLGEINYLPVAGFFFLSGYGLMTKCIKKSKFNFIKGFLKIYIPYIIATFIYLFMFGNYNCMTLIKQIFLINVGLPYGWYVRTYLIIYFIWFISNKLNDNKHKILCTICLLIIYSILFRITGQILTSYKTVFAFAFGLLFALNENKISKYINLYSFIFFIIMSRGILFIISNNETILDAILYNISGIFFCISLVFIIYNFNIQCILLDRFKKISYEIYLVQGISQCIFMKTYFCSKSYLYLSNKFLITILSVFCTFVFGYILNKIDNLIFKVIYKK